MSRTPRLEEASMDTATRLAVGDQCSTNEDGVQVCAHHSAPLEAHNRTPTSLDLIHFIGI